MDQYPDTSRRITDAAATSTGDRLDAYVDRYATRTHGMTASEVRSLFSVASRPEVVSLAGGMPNISGLPMDVVGSLLTELVDKRGLTAMQYGSGQGDALLREQICEIMQTAGIHGHPDDVTVTVGSQQALDLVTRIFIDPGDVILAEAPSYVGALSTFRSYQADVVHIEMDDDGLVPDRLREAIQSVTDSGRRIKFLYTIPNYHNPAGVTLPPERRTEILEICQQADVLIIEDDPYGLLGFDTDCPRALRADDDERVIYLGSFSKTFAPGFRVGWTLAPHAVREKLVLAAESSVLCPPAFSQMAVSQYLVGHDWRGQVKAFREMYRERRDAMLEALDDLMPEGTHWTRPTGGFYVWLTLPSGLDAKAMLPRAVTNRVAYVPGTAFYADGFGSRSMRLSYCYPTPERIREGIRRLAQVVEQEMELRAAFGASATSQRPGLDAPAPNQS
ncbi:PLP-dependent aminotransferase family protein [Actinobacteria bacterium YIM 96077]|uniref:PLP-dependent aminotransferase family protein n=1 Tax=Phytoactinopolyspora halophila TaxID=1981511 RepID=A0A329QQR1_9ACTN|nr:PLP-dependent aminotransferase family protein [Phytoactinopolyspora halophila]AYY15105.1 PLP-dependent aminotransferase family protein [Actinobacteria bacterium YIM 96077]RAW14715.1 PLP-dependent aminotransferase family protein [Phytoactinopolyspora halophila]